MTFGHPVTMLNIGRGRRREHPNQHFVLLLRKKSGGETGHAQNILPVRATSGQVAPSDVTRADIAQFPVACAEHTSDSGHVTGVAR